MSAKSIVFLPLTRGKVAIIDSSDFHLVRGRKYFAHGRDQLFYAARTENNHATGKNLTVRLHRELLGLKSGDPRHVDHIDGDGLNNTRANLRICTQAENNRNRRSSRWSASKFLGVSKGNGNKWKAEGGLPNSKGGRAKHVYLGEFHLEQGAAFAYDTFARKHYGEFARCNFPDM